jgi:hypothetical protein
MRRDKTTLKGTVVEQVELITPHAFLLVRILEQTIADFNPSRWYLNDAQSSPKAVFIRGCLAYFLLYVENITYLEHYEK